MEHKIVWATGLAKGETFKNNPRIVIVKAGAK